MIQVRKKELVKSDNKIPRYRMEIDVDTASELPDVDYFTGEKIAQGSIGWDISTGDFYGMKSDGTWVKQGE